MAPSPLLKADIGNNYNSSQDKVIVEDLELTYPGSIGLYITGNDLYPELLNKQFCSMSINSEPVVINPLDFKLDAEGKYYYTFLVTDTQVLTTGYVSIQYATRLIKFELIPEP